MRDKDFPKLLDDTQHELLAGLAPAGVLGLTPVTLRLLASLVPSGLDRAIEAIHAPQADGASPGAPTVPVRPLRALGEAQCGLLVVAADAEKEDLLCAALPFIGGAPKVIVAGYGHLGFRDRVFEEEQAQLLVPSLANGYLNFAHSPATPVLGSMLLGSASSGVRFVLACSMGGTTYVLIPGAISNGSARLPPVIGPDTSSAGSCSPPLAAGHAHDHPDRASPNLAAVRRYLDGRNIEIIAGDITSTSCRLEGEDLVLSFIDTDNYTPARAAIEVARERTVPGGAIVFDHFTGTNRFRYTLGERIAGRVLLEDPRWFHLHGTGVFYRQRAVG